MESNNKLKDNDIKNRTCYYFDDGTRFEDFDLDDILIYEKSHKNILVYNISYKTLIGTKALHIRFNKTNGFIWVYDGTRYSVLFGGEKYDLIGAKNGVTFAVSHNYAKIKTDS